MILNGSQITVVTDYVLVFHTPLQNGLELNLAIVQKLARSQSKKEKYFINYKYTIDVKQKNNFKYDRAKSLNLLELNFLLPIVLSISISEIKH